MAEVELSEIAAIMAGNDPEEQAEEPTAPPAEQVAEEPSASETPDDEPQAETPIKLTVKDIADKLDMSAEQVYQALSIKVGDTELSLSALKDGVKDLDRANELRESAQSHKIEAENDILRQRRELTQAMQRYQPTEAEKQQAEQEYQQYVATENQAAILAIPEWKDPAAQTAGLTDIAELLNDYAFSPSETQTMVDHRYLKLVNDYAQIRKRLKAASVAVKDTKQQRSKTQRKAPATGSDKAVQMHKAGNLDKTSTIAAIIADGVRQS